MVEFLLINHPLDCPVCDKGGECPLQDITYGWGPGTSRFIEPKRHFKKPLELSPLIAIDRERCILCYRCVRYSQEVSEDYQLVLHERGARVLRRHVRRPPVRRAVQRQHHRALPGGRADLAGVPLPRAAVGHRGRGHGLRRLRRAVQRRADRPRRPRPARPRPRPRRGRRRLAVRQGPLQLPGRALRRAHHARRWCARASELLPAQLGQGARRRRSALKKAGDRARPWPAARRPTKRPSSSSSCCATTSAPATSRRAPAPSSRSTSLRALADPKLQASVPDLEFAHTVLLVDCDPIDEAPVWDLRIRKGVRRHGTKLVVASARPTALDPIATATLRFAPGGGEGFLVALDAALSGDAGNLGGAATSAGSNATAIREFADALRAAGEEVVIVYGERALHGTAGRALLNVASRLNLARSPARACSSCRARPTAAASARRASRPATARATRRSPLPAATPTASPRAWRAATCTRSGCTTSTRCATTRTAPRGSARLGTAQTVIAVESQLTDTVREFADVVFPAEAYPEKEGTLVHPDGRVQRLRPAIGRPRGAGGSPAPACAPLWQVITDSPASSATRPATSAPARRSRAACSTRSRSTPGSRSRRSAAAACAGSSARSSSRPPGSPRSSTSPRPPPPPGDGKLRLGTYRPLWAAKEVDLSPALQFIRARQIAELSPADAAALGINEGDRVEVGNGTRCARP